MGEWGSGGIEGGSERGREGGNENFDENFLTSGLSKLNKSESYGTSRERTNAVSDGIHKSVETNGFYQTPNSMAIKAIREKLTAADWALWAYLQMIDPFGDKMIELPKIPEIAKTMKITSRQIKRSLSRLEELELYVWEPILVRGQNLAGKKAKELCHQKRINKSSEKIKMTDLSDSGQSCPNDDRIVQTMTDLSKNGQNCPNREPEPLPSNGSKFASSYSVFIQTLSEGERENFLEFSEKESCLIWRTLTHYQVD